MQIRALIKTAEAAESGFSKATGNEFRVQQVLLEMAEEDGTVHHFRYKLFTRDLEQFPECTAKAGDIIEGKLQLMVSLYKGNPYNDVRITEIRKV